MRFILSERVTNYASAFTLQVAQDEQCSLRHVRDRIALVGLGAVLAATNTIDALLGHAELLVELVTLGKVQIEDTETTRKRYSRLFQIVRQPFVCLVSALHPAIAHDFTKKVHDHGFDGRPVVSGFVSGIGALMLAHDLNKLCKSSAFLTRHVVSRLVGLGICLAFVVARVTEVALGVLAAVPVLFLQRWLEGSDLCATAGLLLTPAGIAFDLTVGVTAIVAPQSFGAALRRCGVIGHRSILDAVDDAQRRVGEVLENVGQEGAEEVELP